MSLGLYIGMGWAIVVAIKPLIVSVATGGIVFLILGGLAYTTGTLFYCRKKLKFHHSALIKPLKQSESLLCKIQNP